MHLIPVIDLLDRQVVRAVRGQRGQYQPIVSQLCAGSDPVTIACAMLRHCAANTLYIADLDALTGRAPQVDTLLTLCRALPQTELWLDGGFSSAAEAGAVLARLAGAGARVRPVFGSESLQSGPNTAPFSTMPDALLSLDRRQGTPLGRTDWWHDSRAWPNEVIVMTLDRVGAFEGPDLALFDQVRAQAGPHRRLIGAGGIRDDADLAAAASRGSHAWLTASAIHDLRIPPAT